MLIIRYNVYLTAYHGKIKKIQKGEQILMKVYYVCKYCDQVYNIVEVSEQAGIMEIEGVCNECVLEMGLIEEPHLKSLHYYN